MSASQPNLKDDSMSKSMTGPSFVRSKAVIPRLSAAQRKKSLNHTCWTITELVRKMNTNSPPLRSERRSLPHTKAKYVNQASLVVRILGLTCALTQTTEQDLTSALIVIRPSKE